MFLFVCTALLAALFLGLKFTKDIFPRPLKLWLLRKAISNWMRSQPQKFGREVIFEPKTYEETGLLPNDQEVTVERPLKITNPVLRDELVIYGTDEESRGIFVKVMRLPNDHTQVHVLLALKNGMYHVSYEGETPSDYEFSLGNLKMEMVEPFRIWRLWYNGIMTRISKGSTEMEEEEEELVHVAFNVLWKALDNPLDNRKDGNASLLANHFSSSGLFGENLPSLWKILPEGYSQMGTLHGNVNISDRQDDSDSSKQQNNYELYLYGFRKRNVVSSLEVSRMLDIFPLSQKMKGSGNDCQRRFEFFGICENGNGFRLTAFNDKWTDGRMLWSSYETTPVTGVDFSPSEIAHNSTIPKIFNISDSTSTFVVDTWPYFKAIEFEDGEQITLLNLAINGRKANGVLISNLEALKARGCNESEHKQKLFENSASLLKPELNQKIFFLNENGCCNFDEAINNYEDGGNRYLLEFSETPCLQVNLVGGKGASLARIQSLSRKLNNPEVKTAQGFCLTTNLFRRLLDLEKFAEIFNRSSKSSTATSNDSIGLEDACSTVMKMIKSCDATEISTLITERIKKIFGENRNIKFAVRSSGVLEDGSDLSCAGQNATFLGVPQSSIPQKVMDCWASLFTPQSVQYRLNHGQPVVSEMGVVIQEMVDASAAGVIFTADPRTGNPFEMIISANYGLGESVVSGIADPDTIILIRQGSGESRLMGKKCREKLHNGFITVPSRRSKWWSDVTVKRKVLGEKKIKIVHRTPGAGEKLETVLVSPYEKRDATEEISIDDKDSKQFCVDDEKAVKLGIIAAKIEELMGHHKPVDIEWAISQTGQLYILQCRNLTALDAWTDFEISHELDSSVRVTSDRFTTANSGEVLPKAIHTITQTMNRCLDLIVQKQVYKRKGSKCPVSPYRNNSCPLFQQRLFINMYQTLYANVEEEITTASVCIDQTVFGRQVIDEEIRKTAAERFGTASGASKIKDFYSQMKLFKKLKSTVDDSERVYKHFELDYSNVPKKALDVYQKLSEDLIHIYQSGVTHLVTTTCSSGSQVFLFLFLSEGKPSSEWGSSLFEDASKLLSVFQNVESAEMPEDINRLGDEIIRYGGEESHITKEFLQVSPPTKALEWLRINDKVSQALDTFFEKHGHRGFAELDIGEPSWKSDPLSFLPILRNTLKNKLKQREDRSKTTPPANVKTVYRNDDELLDSLSSNLKPMTRRLLKFILPTCRNAVVCREKTKSLFVRVIDQFKQQYKYLAQLMVQENLLPSESLITHLTHFEIGQLVKGDVASSIILQKAMKRYKMYSHMEKLEFPEICVGIPKELDSSVPVTVTDTIQATPVSRGVVKGIAKVCLSVEEASENLHPGDILITHGTDIAWSPFFPVLGGVVTELGGLISHGAVVAREYGLPCIVGAVNATKIFKSGDHVILDAGKGTLSKVFE